MRKSVRGLGATFAVTALALAAAAPASAQDPPPPCPSGLTYESGGPPRAGDPNDPLYEEQWGLGQINAPGAWNRGDRGAGVVIAIVDSGADLGHPDLQAHLVPGVDFVPPAEDGCPGSPQDENGHGTHVSGIAAAVTNNGIGVAGTARDASIMPVRVLNHEGSGTFENVVKGIRYAADNGAKVINLSLGGDPVIGQTPQLNQDLEEAVDYAWSKGAVIVGAAGNESVPACGYPSAAKRAICVAATDRRQAPTFYSNFPADPDSTPGFRAPGGSGPSSTGIFCEVEEDIWSTILPNTFEDCDDDDGSSAFIAGYDTLAGTSMSAPFVSGVAAILMGKGMTNQQVVDCLKATSYHPGGARGMYEPTYGWGIVDAGEASLRCSSAGIGGSPSPVGPGPGSLHPERVRFSMRLLPADLRTVVRRRRLPFRTRAGERGLRISLAATIRVAGGSQNAGNRIVIGRRNLRLRARGTRRGSVRISKAGARALRRRGSRARITLYFRARDRQGNVKNGTRSRTYRRR